MSHRPFLSSCVIRTVDGSSFFRVVVTSASKAAYNLR